jgi:hypothetical protein
MAEARRHVRDSLTRLRTVSDDAPADEITRRSSRDQVTMATEELAMLALGVPFDRPPPPPSAAQEVVDRLDRLAEAVESGGTTSPGGRTGQTSPSGPASPSEATSPTDHTRPRGAADNTMPDLPGYPRTRAALELLESAIG